MPTAFDMIAQAFIDKSDAVRGLFAFPKPPQPRTEAPFTDLFKKKSGGEPPEPTEPEGATPWMTPEEFKVYQAQKQPGVRSYGEMGSSERFLSRLREGAGGPIAQAVVTPIKGIGLSATDIVGIGLIAYGGYQAATQGWNMFLRSSLSRNFDSWAKSAGKEIPQEIKNVFVNNAMANLSKKWLSQQAIKTIFRPTTSGLKAVPEAAQRAEQEIVSLVKIEAPRFIPSFTPGGTAIPGQIKSLAEIMATGRAELLPKIPTGQAPGVTKYSGKYYRTEVGAPQAGVTFFTKNRDYAEELQRLRGKGAIREENLELKNPLVVEATPKQFSDPAFEEKYIDKAIVGGNDAVVFVSKVNGDVFVARLPGVEGVTKPSGIPLATSAIPKAEAGQAIPPLPPLPPSATGATKAIPPTAGILGDLQDTDELVTVMTQPDTYRKIANLPGVRKVMSYLNPSGIANTAPEKAVVARAALREEGANKVIGAFSNLEAVGRRDKIWGKLDDAQRLTQGRLTGKSLDEVLTYRTKYALDMTPQQVEWSRAFHELEIAKLDLLERNGIPIHQLSFEEGGEYVGRRVVGRIDPQTGELAESAFVGAPGPGRPGARMGAEKTRYFKDINEALEQGFRYLPSDEALYLNLKGAYNRVADKQVTDWVLERIAYRTTGAPQALIDAASLAKTKLNKSKEMLSSLNRALRGERGVPEQIVNSIATEYPAEAKTLRVLIDNIRLGKPTGDAVKLFESKAKQLITNNKAEYWQAVNARARAREAALQTHLGEARVSAPSFAGKILTGPEARETAETLNKAFVSTYGDIDSIIGAVNKVNAIGRYFMLAGDASPLLIQLIAFPFRFPVVFAKSAVGFTKALFSPEAQASYLAINNAVIQKSHNLILSKGGQTEFTEAFRSGGIMQSKLAKYPKAVLEPFQRAFEGAIDTAGIELRKAFDYMATTPERTAAIEQFINEMRGVTSSARLGVTPGIRAAETVVLLAPRYMRASLALVSDIARGGIRGDQARKAMIALTGGMAALVIGITLARGEGWKGVKNHLDITKSTQFLTWDIAGQNVGPGSKFRSFLILLGRMIRDPIKMVDHASNFMRSNSSIAVSTGYDILTGRDYIGEPTRPGKGVSFGEGMLALTKRVIADNLVPIWLQSAALEGGDIEQRLTRGVVEFFGGRAYPASAGAIYAEKWRDDFKTYIAIPSNEIERKGKLKAAKTLQERALYSLSRAQYRVKYPLVEAKLFISGQVNTVSTLAAMNSALALIKENKIDPDTITGIRLNKEEQVERKKLGVPDTRITLTDRLVRQLTASKEIPLYPFQGLPP